MICSDQFDRLAQQLATKVVNGHLDRCGTALAVAVGVLAGHVGQESQANLVLGMGRGSQQATGQRTGRHGGVQGKGRRLEHGRIPL
ncbi:hypothetical protein D3C72_1358530 [compost metagenome]